MKKKLSKPILAILLMLLLFTPGGCKKINMNDSPNQSKQAIESMKKFFHVFFETQDAQAIKELTTTPFLLDQQIYQDINSLIEDFAKSEMGQYPDLEVEVQSAELINLNDFKTDFPTHFKRLENYGLDKKISIIKIKVHFLFEHGEDTDEGYALMTQENGYWKINGLL